METVGEHLRRVRKTCGYSVEDVARVTKINLRYIEAIENDDFSKIPGDTFVQGFLRSYARFLGIDEREIISRFKEKGGSGTPVVDLQSPGGREGVTKNSLPPLRKNIKIVLPVALGVISLFFILIIFAGDREPYTVQSSKEAGETGVENKEMHEVEDDEKNNKIAQAVSVPVHIKIFAKELTWVQARIDGKENKEALLKPGEVVLWEGEDKITVTLGNAGGVNVEVNGKAQEPLGKKGEVVRDIVITGNGLSRGMNN